MPNGTSWLLDVPAQQIYIDGTLAEPTVRQWNFIGADATYNATTQRMDITIGGGGFDWQESVLLATVAALPANTRTNSTLTANGVGALTVDGTAASAGDRVLVKDEGGGASHPHNGLYEVDDAGSGATQWSMTRVVTADETGELTSGMTVLIEGGATLNKQYWYVYTNDPITINATAIEFRLAVNPLLSVIGPGASTDEAIARWDGVTGQLLQDSTTTITDAGEFRLPAAGALRLGLAAGAGAGAAAGTGQVRGQNNVTVVSARNNADAADIDLVATDASDHIYIGDTANAASLYYDGTGSHILRVSGTSAVSITSASCSFNLGLVTFEEAVAVPIITHVADTSAAATGADLTIQAQGVSHAGGGGDSGALLLRGGRGTGGATNTDGNVALGELPATWQTGEEIVFLSDAVSVPTGAVANGLYLWSASQILSTSVPIAIGVPTLTPVAASGDVRVASGTTALASRNNADGNDLGLLTTDASDNLTIGGANPTRPANIIIDPTTTIDWRIGGSNAAILTSSILELRVPTLRFDIAEATPIITQEADPNAGVTGDDLTIEAQGVSDPAGGATSASLLLRGGRGTVHANNTDGSVAIGELPASWQTGEEILFLSDAVTVPTNVAAAGTFIWSGSGVLSTDNPIAIGVPALTPVSASGDIRVANATTALAARNNADGNDLGLITTDVSDNLTIGGANPTRPTNIIADAGTSVQLKVGGATSVVVTGSIYEWQVASVQFDSGEATPVIRQETDSSAGVTGDDLTLQAQSVSDAAGNAVAGDLLLRGGRGEIHANNSDGNIALHEVPANWQSSEEVLFVSDAVTVPAGNPAAGYFSWSEGGVPMVRQTMGPASPADGGFGLNHNLCGQVFS